MAKKTEIKKFDVLSVAKINGMIGVIIGFFIGLFIAIFAGFGAVAASAAGMPGPGFIAGLGILAIIVVPIIYGIMLFVMGAVGAFIYNIIADRIGGIVFES